MDPPFVVAEHICTALGVIDIQGKGAVIIQIGKEKDHIFPPVAEGHLAGQDLIGILLKDPLQQIVDIVKMIIKGLPVDVADLHQVFHRDLFNRFNGQHLFERITKSFFCVRGHFGTTLSLHF